MGDQVTLTATSAEIQNLIESERHTDAIALCQHVLRYFPKHIDTYRQMAEATLGKGDLQGARELFGRVLSGDPENIVAYVSLALIFEKQHLLEEAHWYLERAHELSPADSEIRNELLRLSSEQNRSRGRLKITPGGLARLYAVEGLFMQAAQEFRRIAGNQPKRFDARVALAEVLWRAGRLSEAADAAQSLLRVLPYCLKANLILGMVLEQSGVQESEAHFQLAEALDPTNRVARDLFGAQSPLRPNDPGLPRYAVGAFPVDSDFGVLEPEVEEAGNWFLRQAPIPPAPAPEAAQAQEQPFPTEIAEETHLDSATVPAPAAAETAVESPDTAADEQTVLPDTAADEQTVLPDTAADEQIALPDWLLQEATAQEQEPPSIGEQHGPPTEQTHPFADQAPSLPQETPVPQEIPDEFKWTETLSFEPVEPTVPPVAQTTPVPDALPDWLSEAPAVQPLQAEEQETPASQSSPVQDLPAWLEPPVESAAATESTPIPGEQQSPAEPTPPESELPPWLRADFRNAPRPSSPTSRGTPKPTVSVRSSLPPWLTDLHRTLTDKPDKPAAETPPPSATPVEVPAWLSEQPPQVETPAPPAADQAAAGEAVDAELPDWLAAAPARDQSAPTGPAPSPTETPAAPAPAEPDWLAASAPPSAPPPSTDETGTAAELDLTAPEKMPPPSLRRRQIAQANTKLELARAYIEANQIGLALDELEYVVANAPLLVPQVIPDLERLVATPNVPLKAHRVLGDAYTRADRLAEALEQYRFVLDRVA